MGAKDVGINAKKHVSNIPGMLKGVSNSTCMRFPHSETREKETLQSTMQSVMKHNFPYPYISPLAVVVTHLYDRFCKTMAYRLNTNVANYAESRTHDPRNAKTRWQKLADISASHARTPVSESRYSDGFAIATEEEFYSQSRNGRSRGRRIREDMSVGLYASRSKPRSRMRSRSRPRTSREPWLDHWFRRLGSAPKMCQLKMPKPANIIALLALVGIITSWFAVLWFPSTGILHSIKTTPWNVQQRFNNLNAGFRHGLCQLPVFPRVLDCRASQVTELVLREKSIRHAIPGILFALSESPDALDEVLDLLEKAETGFRALHGEKPVDFKNKQQPLKQDQDPSTTQEPETEATGGESATVASETTSSQQTSEPGSSLMRLEAWDILRTRKETINALIDLVAYLKDHITRFDYNKEAFLEITRRRVHYHDAQYEQIKKDTKYNPEKCFVDELKLQFRSIVEDDIKDQAKALDGFRDGLEGLGGDWSVLFEQTGILLASETSPDEEKDKPPVRKSLLKSFVLWSSPIDLSRPPENSRLDDLPETPTPKPLIPAQDREQLLNAVQDIYPQLRALHASISKAYTTAKLAKSIIEDERLAWWNSRGGQTFDEDIMRGMREAVNMVPMLMDQRRGQRTKRAYERVLASWKARRRQEDERFEDLLSKYRTKREGR